MREILFRGKRIDNGEWVAGDLYHRIVHIDTFHQNTVVSAIEVFDGENPLSIAYYTIVPKTVGQFTGLTDTNGTKIFEGDIVEIAREDEPFKVEWCEDSARFILSASTFCCDFDNYWGYETEVIGNIHDNPELLGGAEDG